MIVVKAQFVLLDDGDADGNSRCSENLSSGSK